jgi:protein SCO1/2
MRRVLLWMALCLLSAAATYAQTPVANLGGHFELTDQNGKPFSSSTVLTGQPYAIFFGFTNCPDICPTTLLEMSNALGKLGVDGDRLKVLFVTLDPERDTPANLRTYLSSFDARIIGLTGTVEQIAAVAKLWNASFYKLLEDDGSYTIVHSAYVYLMDRDHHFSGTLVFQDAEAVQLEKLKSLLH